MASFSQKMATYHRSPESIVPAADRSVLYTNSAIIPFKRMIFENKIPYESQYLLQECIRLHETKLTPDEQIFSTKNELF